jgi:hypothetical protein
VTNDVGRVCAKLGSHHLSQPESSLFIDGFQRHDSCTTGLLPLKPNDTAPN